MRMLLWTLVALSGAPMSCSLLHITWFLSQSRTKKLFVFSFTCLLIANIVQLSTTFLLLMFFTDILASHHISGSVFYQTNYTSSKSSHDPRYSSAFSPSAHSTIWLWLLGSDANRVVHFLLLIKSHAQIKEGLWSCQEFVSQQHNCGVWLSVFIGQKLFNFESVSFSFPLCCYHRVTLSALSKHMNAIF